MKKTHIEPFKYAIENNIEMIMVAHLHCTCFDKDTIPSSLSKNALTYLRKELGYNGVVISDDMVMKGVQAYGSLEAVIMGIKAGLDMFIFRDSDAKTIEMIQELCLVVEKDEFLKKRVEESYNRILRLKEKYCI
jgi:beta-N-acetylhexosaminidase